MLTIIAENTYQALDKKFVAVLLDILKMFDRDWYTGLLHNLKGLDIYRRFLSLNGEMNVLLNV